MRCREVNPKRWRKYSLTGQSHKASFLLCGSAASAAEQVPSPGGTADREKVAANYEKSSYFRGYPTPRLQE
jgi:hypothetical protein